MQNAIGALRRLRENGFAAYLVGGCVRDLLLYKTPHDFDITTSARPEEMQRVFADVPTFATGLQHGTLTVVWEKTPLEITTFRTDGAYTDGRHPQSVTFSRQIADDLQRRDFTVNAMALLPKGFSPLPGETGPFMQTPLGLLIDLYGGQADLEQKTLRCVGDVDTRFTEDALRILRAARFACTLGFAIEEETFAAMRRKKAGLRKISAERKWAELQKLLAGEKPGKVLWETRDVLEEVLPGLMAAQNIAALDADILPPAARLGALCFLLYGKAENAAEKTETLLKNLRSDKHSLQQSILQVQLLCSTAWPEEKTDSAENVFRLKKLCADYGVPAVRVWLQQRVALSGDGSFSAALQRLTRWEKENACLSLSQLAVNGHDLLALGVPPQKVGSTLHALLDGVLRGELPNEKPALLQKANTR